MNLYLLKFNNYYNRILKKYDTITEYLNAVASSWVQLHVSFNPNDGVSTEHVIGNIPVVQQAADFGYDYLVAVNHKPKDEGWDELGINSRWFIINATRTRTAQYNLTLKRDLLADNYDNIKNAPAFIERGNLTKDDPMIFNDEGLKYNQIKSGEFKLYDASRCAWIVGYVPRRMLKVNNDDTTGDTGFDPTSTSVNYTLSAQTKGKFSDPDAEHTFSSWTDLQTRQPILYALLQGTRGIKRQSDTQYSETKSIITNQHFKSYRVSDVAGSAYNVGNFGILLQKSTRVKRYYTYNTDAFNKKDGLKDSRKIVTTDFTGTMPAVTNLGVLRASDLQALKDYFLGIFSLYNDNKATYDAAFKTAFNVNNSDDNVVINKFADSVIKIGTKYFVIKLDKIASDSEITIANSNVPTALKNLISDGVVYGVDNSVIIGVPSMQIYHHGIYVNRLRPFSDEVYAELIQENRSFVQCEIKYKCDEYAMSYSELDMTVHTVIKNNTNRQHCYDAPYDMFCIPYSTESKTISMYVKTSNSTVRKLLSADAGMAIAQEMVPKLGTKNVYDIQILPYCPITEWYHTYVTSLDPDAETIQAFTLDSTDARVSEIQDQDGVVQNYIIWCNSTSFNGSILQNYRIRSNGSMISQWGKTWEIANDDPKQQRCLDKYRLASGNYSNIFEFTPAMNDGITKFNYYCDYKPYQPFVKVNPEFNYLYGTDFKDANGIILSGDFSLTQLTNAWTEYKLNNKNYQAAFDRNIQSLNLQQSIQMQEAKIGAVTGAISSGAKGAVNGFMAGGPVGAVVGGVVGTATSAIGSAIDISNMDKLQTDAIENQKAQFKYQLQNIQALPETIQKITGFTQINKLVPVLEYYTCTEQEKAAFDSYITYNAMTVGRIDEIDNFKDEGGFIQGYFVRLSDLNTTYTEATALNEAFKTGFYFNKDE